MKNLLIGFPLLMMLFGCSVISGTTQDFAIRGSLPADESLYVNGSKTPVPSTLVVEKNRSLTFMVVNKTGNVVETKTVVPVFSTAGKLDMIFTPFFIVPAIGLFSDGSMELETTYVQF